VAADRGLLVNGANLSRDDFPQKTPFFEGGQEARFTPGATSL
jgi:hypothetical protein